ncbi:DUF934 domain-containing protein [Rhodobacteraceae bacterium CCMM004]|nr:DUF934 domain-containing protein [Rhodobacteraceae bacterium CCMM004]
MAAIVTDAGFAPDDWIGPVAEIAPDADPAALAAVLDAPLVRVAFPSFADGRGFTLAADLRRMGYGGRLRAAGHVLADQYAMARRAGFDEVEIAPDLARRQPQAQWLARADWQRGDYRARLGGRLPSFPAVPDPVTKARV